MTDITPEEVAKMQQILRGGAFWHYDKAYDKAADMLETLAAKLDSTLKDRALILAERDMLRLCTQAAEAENARLHLYQEYYEAIVAFDQRPLPSDIMPMFARVDAARAALTTKEQTNDK
jgi:BioD-like phosphotransacetylase family protein